MKTEIDNLKSEIRLLEQKLSDKKDELTLIILKCSHTWGPVESDHIFERGYTIPGDPPGTMGVDYRGPVYVDAKTIKRWRRECFKCGKVEYTSNVEQHITETPKFE